MKTPEQQRAADLAWLNPPIPGQPDYIDPIGYEKAAELERQSRSRDEEILEAQLSAHRKAERAARWAWLLHPHPDDLAQGIKVGAICGLATAVTYGLIDLAAALSETTR